MSTVKKILIAEDDESIAMLEQDYLEINGFAVETAADGAKALEMALKNPYDLIILDIMLPIIDGYDICKKIRAKKEIPIIMVTAKQESIDVIRGLGLGADDYILKPFNPLELVARVKANLQRFERLTSLGGNPNSDEIVYENLRLVKNAWKIYVDGKEIEMANKEFELLSFLMSNPNIVFSKEYLFESIWGYDYLGDSATVAVHINRIRDKIEPDRRENHFISTVRGAGYRFNMKTE